MRAILSVYDKSGITDFARGLVGLGWEIFSTGGTLSTLKNAGVPARSISDLTDFPEILDGRVKTLHPKVHGGLLGRRSVASHRAQMQEHGIEGIDMVVVNLYPFVETVARPNVSWEEAIENIDIGGPAMLRSAAKNHEDVLVICDPDDYRRVLPLLSDGVSPALRRELAAKAYQHTATYDTAVAQYLRLPGERFPQDLTVALHKVRDLRYGENPHQQAALYCEQIAGLPLAPNSLVNAEQLGGAELSYNNILDLESAVTVVFDFAAPAVTIIKHNNPCGLACDEDIVEAYQLALAGDPISAFGGIVGVNRAVTAKLAEAIRETFYEAIVAPAYDPAALEILRKKKNLRILKLPAASAFTEREDSAYVEYRRVRGGMLVQTGDRVPEDAVHTRVVTERHPTLEELTDLMFAWRAVKHVRSNAIVLARGLTMVGMGAGQPNRVTSVRLAVEKAGARAMGSILASDAFFPFPDGVAAAADAGVTAIIQPGGSIRDEEAIRVANRHHMAMLFTGQRHFKH
jgi:phosphoribosylaminoimidazolecarboxamide formyltransferase/IMP cyclohydrolase